MKTLFLCSVFLVGCASVSHGSKAMYEQDERVTKLCLAKNWELPLEEQLKVNESIGKSLLTEGLFCYGVHMRAAVKALNYRNADLVAGFADYMLQLSRARDAGLIDYATMSKEKDTMAAHYRQLIDASDRQNDGVAAKQFADKLAIFAGKMSAMSIEQDAIRAANRPITTHCGPSGPFNTTSITCISR
jgi:hypothetical protein